MLKVYFLVVPIVANPRKKGVWEPILEKCRKRLSKWKQKILSFGERLTLINFVLSSDHILFLSILGFWWGVARKITRLRGSSFGGGNEEVRKITWVKWEVVCRMREQGGLEVKNIEMFNKALLGNGGGVC